MAEPKTRPTGASVAGFLKTIADDERHADCLALVRLMTRITGSRPKMWGPSIVGFGTYHTVYASGREGDWPLVGFSPRKQDLTIYVMSGFAGRDALLARLGRHRTGKACLYLKRLADVDRTVLEALVTASVRHMRRTRG